MRKVQSATHTISYISLEFLKLQSAGFQDPFLCLSMPCIHLKSLALQVFNNLSVQQCHTDLGPGRTTGRTAGLQLHSQSFFGGIFSHVAKHHLPPPLAIWRRAILRCTVSICPALRCNGFPRHVAECIKAPVPFAEARGLQEHRIERICTINNFNISNIS